MERVPHILIGVARGNINPIDYSNLEFPKVFVYPVSFTEVAIQRKAYALLRKGTFIGWCMQNWGSSECTRIFTWIRGDKTMDWAETIDDLKKAMREHESWGFRPIDFRIVDTAHQQFLAENSSDQGESQQADYKT